MDCKHATRLLSQALDRKLALRQRLSLRLHLLLCDACTQFFHQLGLLRQAVRQFSSRVEHDESLKLSDAARTRIAGALSIDGRSASEAGLQPGKDGN
jgi:hypothetical protein